MDTSQPKGKVITLLGPNNLGKTTQANRLARRIYMELGLYACAMKYAVYTIQPTGAQINEYLRGGNPKGLSPEQFQMLQVQNRLDYEPQLRHMLNHGVWVVAEDYCGTGIAWGITEGVDKQLLVEKNSVLLKEDLTILIDGERFIKGREENHTHEGSNEKWNRARQVHLELAEEWGWTVVKNTGRSLEEIHEEIWQLVVSRFAAALG